jgi:hypothetical protein
MAAASESRGATGRGSEEITPVLSRRAANGSRFGAATRQG